MEEEKRHSSQVPPTTALAERQQSSSYADIVKRNESYSNGTGKQFWKQSNQPKWTPGKFINVLLYLHMALGIQKSMFFIHTVYRVCRNI